MEAKVRSAGGAEGRVKMAIILGRWSDYNSMREDWFDSYSHWNEEKQQYEAEPIPETFPSEDKILFASYGGGSYDGDAFVLFEENGKLYEVHGSHCSCYGLEGQWKPEETSIEALRKKDRKTEENHYWYFLSDHDDAASEKYWAMIDSMTPQPEGLEG